MARSRGSSAQSSRRTARFLRLFGLLVLTAGLLTLGQAVPAEGASVPTVTSLKPSGGPLKGGQIILVSGSGFTGATAVKFGAVAATSFSVMSDTKLVAEVPDASAAAKELVAVTTTAGTNTTGSSYDYGAPTIKSVSPGFADPDASKTITITGSGFLGTLASEVKFGTHAAIKVWVISDTQIVATSPITTVSPAVTVAPGVIDVTITRNAVVSATDAKSKFLFTPGIPTITTLGISGAEVTGTAGTNGVAVGSLLTITGTRLWGVSKVKFGKTAVTNSADITVAGDGNSLTVKVPSLGAGPTDVTVENAAGVSVTNLKTAFAFFSTAVPKVSSVYPGVFDKATGSDGTFLVTGSGFTALTTSDVTVKCAADVTPTVVTAVSDTKLIVTTPGSGVAETCDLEIDNPIDPTKTVTSIGAVRFI